MSDRPILFSASMVRTLLSGTKTQTRRVLKPQPEPWRGIYQEGGCQRSDWHFTTGWQRISATKQRYGLWMTCQFHEPEFMPLRCAPGDCLWVREGARRSPHAWHYAADGAAMAWPARDSVQGLRRETISPIFLPRAASRLTLTVTDVRVQRLHDISEEDARAEGCPFTHDGRQYDPPDPNVDSWQGYGRASFCLLWNSITGAGSWDANPWVAAYTFTVEKRNIDA